MGPRSDLLYPLDEFYELAGIPLPVVISVPGPDVPAPYRELLAHDRDMTPTLEEAYGQRIELRVLNHSLGENLLSRQIVLALEGDGRAVAYGAIKIYLEHFPPKARALVLEMKMPLGTILRTEGIEHNSRPAGYFRVQADRAIGDALQIPRGALLYGRQNVLSDTAHHTLARVLEIMTP